MPILGQKKFLEKLGLSILRFFNYIQSFKKSEKTNTVENSELMAGQTDTVIGYFTGLFIFVGSKKVALQFWHVNKIL